MREYGARDRDTAVGVAVRAEAATSNPDVAKIVTQVGRRLTGSLPRP